MDRESDKRIIGLSVWSITPGLNHLGKIFDQTRTAILGSNGISCGLPHLPTKLLVIPESQDTFGKLLRIIRNPPIHFIDYGRACRGSTKGDNRHSMSHGFNNLYLLPGASENRADNKPR